MNLICASSWGICQIYPTANMTIWAPLCLLFTQNFAPCPGPLLGSVNGLPITEGHKAKEKCLTKRMISSSFRSTLSVLLSSTYFKSAPHALLTSLFFRPGNLLAFGMVLFFLTRLMNSSHLCSPCKSLEATEAGLLWLCMLQASQQTRGNAASLQIASMYKAKNKSLDSVQVLLIEKDLQVDETKGKSFGLWQVRDMQRSRRLKP